jgi:hypothetical protein
MNLNGNFMILFNSLDYLQHCEVNVIWFFKRNNGASSEVTGEMDSLFQELIEHQRENLLKLLVFKHE